MNRLGIDVEALPHALGVVGSLSLGGLLGFAAGRGLRLIGSLLIVAVGLLFLAVQALAYAGYVVIDWTAIERGASSLLPDGTIASLWQPLVAVLTHDLPFAAGFVPGLVLGLRRGGRRV